MATIEELQNALVKADAAGDAAGAKMLADHIRSIQPSENANALPQPAERSWGDTLTSAVGNIPSSAINMASGIGEAIMNPSRTAGQIMDLGAGAAAHGVSSGVSRLLNRTGISDATPQDVLNAIERIDPNPEAGRIAQQTASNLGNVYKKGYGSIEGFKERLATDPLAVAGDVSTLLTGGGTAATKLGALSNSTKAAKLGEILSTAGNLSNPVSLSLQGASGLANLGGRGLASALGSPLMTGVGGQTVKTAFTSGKNWNPDFIKNLSGQVPIDDVLHSAKQNLQVMSDAKAQAYRSGMIDISKDKSILQFGGIDDALKDASGKATYGGKVVNQKAFKAVQDAKQAIDQWKSGEPSIFATPEGMDKLKQKIGAIQESIPFEEKTARLAVGGIYNSIKNEISKQAPTYSKTMGEYQGASKEIDEITKTLSLSPTAQADTAIRKLQSLTRNNVNSNYGRRAELADLLSKKGGKDIMPSLAGQAMNEWTGRGMGSHIGTGALTTAAFTANPYAAVLLPLQSPKLVGAGANALGYAAGTPGKIFDAIPGTNMLTTDKAKALALLLQQSQQGNQ